MGYEVFDGTPGDQGGSPVTDSRTVETIPSQLRASVESMEKKYGKANRVWVMDRGMVSEANLKFLGERGGSYIVGTPKAML